MQDLILEVDAIEKKFGQIQAVDRLSFSVRRGEIFALLGPNGAGKSTSVRMLVDILRPDAGRIEFHLDGKSYGRLDPTLMGYLPEDRGLYPEVPLIKTLTYMGAIRGLERSVARRAAMGWLEKLGLADRADDKLDALSKGNQQKVQFIGAILHQPAFAVLDEPFSGLDPLHQDIFLDILRELQAAGTTVLLSAHQMQLVERVADRVLVLSQGREVLSGTISSIKANARTSSRILLRLTDRPEASSLTGYPGVAGVEWHPSGELAVELGTAQSLSSFLSMLASRHEISSIRSEEPSLHEIFVSELSGLETGIETLAKGADQ